MCLPIMLLEQYRCEAKRSSGSLDDLDGCWCSLQMVRGVWNVKQQFQTWKAQGEKFSTTMNYSSCSRRRVSEKGRSREERMN
jgi:hypothetical protein